LPDKDIEIVIQDNSDTDELQEFVKSFRVDRRLKYENVPERVDVITNCNRALARAGGEYVCLLGDDDGIQPEIVAAARWAKNEGFDALVPSSAATFVWPDLSMSTRSAMRPGELRIVEFSGAITFPVVEKELRKCLNDAGQKFHDLPKLYYGLVRRDIMEQVRRLCGSYFPAISPDMAASVAIAQFARRVCRIDYPLFLPGASFKSTAGLGGLRQHVGRLSDQRHLPRDCEAKWTDMVPPFFSVPTIWAEASLETLLACGREDLLQEFDLPRLYAWLLMFHPGFMLMICRTYGTALQRTRRGCAAGVLALAVCLSQLALLRVKCLLRRFLKQPPCAQPWRLEGLKDIQAAVHELQVYLRSNGCSFGPQGLSVPSREAKR